MAIGRGTQNYTCDLTNSTAVPKAVGAVAKLFNATCLVSTFPDLATILPKVAMQFVVNSVDSRMGPSNLAFSGDHYFTDNTTPFFNLDSPLQKLGAAACTKNASVPAPQDAAKGPKGEAAVPWLKLLTTPGSTGELQEVYRLNTAGGSAPASCVGQPAAFQVEYSAQ